MRNWKYRRKKNAAGNFVRSYLLASPVPKYKKYTSAINDVLTRLSLKEDENDYITGK